MIDKNNKSLTDTRYWDLKWDSIDVPCRLNTKAYFGNHFDWLFKNKLKRGNKRFLEIGCAPGKFMVYFAENFGYEVSGIEYSKSGYEVTLKNMQACGIKADVMSGDIFEYPFKENTWDVVFSAGLVEHYEDLLYVLKRKYSLVKPGGILLTTIPNYAGFHGSIIKHVDVEEFKIHVPFTAEDMFRAYEYLGMKDIDVGYFGSVRLQFPKSYKLSLCKKSILYLAKLLDKVSDVLYNNWRISFDGPKLSSHIFAYGVTPLS